MLSLSPIKLLVVFVVAMILLGPDKLPQVARQVGAAWRSFRQFHERVEREVRETMPDLPSTTEIARMARSPVAFLNRLAEPSVTSSTPPLDPGAAVPAAQTNGAAWPSDPSAQGTEHVDPAAVGAERPGSRPVSPGPMAMPDDPGMN
jgi:TatA/E family protein of Tat protein translocase